MTYRRAYPASDIARFPAAAEAVAGRDVLYVYQDLALHAEAVLPTEAPLLTAAVPGWSEFCQSQLGFEVPAFVTDDDGTG